MSKIALAVFSNDCDYIDHFLTYFRNRDTVFEVFGFTSLQALTNFLYGCKVDILLLSRSYPDSFTDKANTMESEEFSEKIGRLSEAGRIKEIVYLGEQQNIDPASAKNSSAPSGCPCNFKMLDMYRPMTSIISDLSDIARNLTLSQKVLLSSRMKICGVMKFDGSQRLLTFLHDISSAFSNGAFRPICLDLSRFSLLFAAFPSECGHSLTDLIYTMHTESSGFAETLDRCIIHAPGLDYISSPVAPSDLDELSLSEWNTLIDSICKEGGYSGVIILADEGIRDFHVIFELCSDFYILTENPDIISSGIMSGSASGDDGLKCLAFHNYIKGRCGIDFLSKIHFDIND